MADKDYLKEVSAEGFYEILPKRQAVINKASDSEPQYDFNANVLARSLHPKVQHVKVSDIKELNGARVYTLEPDASKGTTKLAYFRAGHYISLKLKIGGSVLTRPYSLCSSPKLALSGKYQIVVKSKTVCYLFKNPFTLFAMPAASSPYFSTKAPADPDSPN